jgi:hypothetical protein
MGISLEPCERPAVKLRASGGALLTMLDCRLIAIKQRFASLVGSSAIAALYLKPALVTLEHVPALGNGLLAIVLRPHCYSPKVH